MAILDNTATVLALYEAINRKDMKTLFDAADANAQVLNVAFDTTSSFQDYFKNWNTAFPDGQIEMTNLAQAGDSVLAEFIGRGTHTGPFDTPGGRIPPTNRCIVLRFCDVYDVRDGKVRGMRAYFDFATLLRQLGLFSDTMIGKGRAAEARPSVQH